MILPILAGVGMLVLGIMITAGKEKSVEVLGIGYIVKSVATIMSGVSGFVSRTVTSASAYAGYSQATSYMTFLCTIGFLFCVCFFLHKNYGKKLIYIPVMAVHVGGVFISRVVTMSLGRLLSSGKDITKWIGITNNIDNFVVEAAVAVIIIIVLYMNRKNEKVIPLAWLCKLIVLVSAALRTMIFVGYQLTLIKNKGIFYISYNMISLFFAVFSFAAVITPFYITLMVIRRRKAAAQTGVPVQGTVPAAMPAAVPEAVQETPRNPEQV